MKRELSDSEWILMKKLWEKAPLTITQLTADLQEETGWSKHTVISLLSRMEAKGAIGHKEGGRAKEYYPILPKNDAVQSVTERFLNRVYDGRVGLLMNAIVDSHALSQKDLEELSAILEQAKGEKEK